MEFIDMHCDTISQLYRKQKKGSRENLYANTGHVDLGKLKAGGALLQNFALFIDMAKTENPLEEALRMADLYYRELEGNGDRIAPVYCFADIEKNRREGKISALLTVEEGGVCRGELAYLRDLYRLGVRMMTLTWNYANEIGYPALEMDSEKAGACLGGLTERCAETPAPSDGLRTETTHGSAEQCAKVHAPSVGLCAQPRGLTDRGREIVEEMERIGMVVDVSHLSDAGFYDVLEITKKPFVASHSNARAVCPSLRNLTDDMIRKLAGRGGVIGLNFCPEFLAEVPGGTPNQGTIADVVAHAKHIIRIGGIDCLGLGSDFDGIDGHGELPDCSYMPRLADTLGKCGLSEDEVEKIFYRNVLRVYGEVLG